MPLQWRNSIWQSLEEGAGKRCWMWGVVLHRLPFQLLWKETKGAGDRGEGRERAEGGVSSGKVDTGGGGGGVVGGVQKGVRAV